MEQSHTWILGTCITGFLFLVGWLIVVDRRTAFTEQVIKELQDIKLALMGTLDKRGLVTAVHDVEQRMMKMEKVCDERHG
jgi:hypothetical protein